MFFYLFLKSTILKNFETNPKFLSILLVGSVCYLVIHAFLSFTNPELFSRLKIYYCVVLLLDSVMTYYQYNNSASNTNNANNLNIDSSNKNFMEQIFELKDTMEGLVTKRDITSSQECQSLSPNPGPIPKQCKKSEPVNDDSNISENKAIQKTQNTDTPHNTDTTQNTETPLETPQKIKDHSNSQESINEPDNSSSLKVQGGGQSTKISDIIKKREIQPEKLVIEDSQSEMGSEIDFDITEFENTLKD